MVRKRRVANNSRLESRYLGDIIPLHTYFMDARMIAHDMRTPLSALTLSIEAAKTSVGDRKCLINSLEIASRNAKALSAIVEALVDTVKMDGKGQLSKRECLPLDLVTSAIDQVAPMAETKKQQLSTGELVGLPPIMVDGTRIIRVLVNLLSNAVRFAPVGGVIRIFAKNTGQDLIFSVSDDGPGVEQDHLETIFLEGVSISKGGKYSSGLGLAVCKELVEAHGGGIWVESNEQGATFSFTIPLASSTVSAGE